MNKKFATNFPIDSLNDAYLTNWQHRKSLHKSTQAGQNSDRASFDNISIVSLASLAPNATTIRVPFTSQAQNSIPAKEHKPLVASASESVTENVKKVPIEVDDKDHFDYKTVIATVHSANNKPVMPKQHQVLDTYNVRVIQHDSPFLTEKQQPIKSVSDLSSSIARLELLSSELGSRQTQQPQESLNNMNNNETSFNLDEYFTKHKAMPAMVDSGIANSSFYDEDDQVSLVSSCSLRSTRTYDVRTFKNNDVTPSEGPEEVFIELNDDESPAEPTVVVDEEELKEKKLAAWIFDPRDNSSTAIIAPPKPPKPEVPKIETEELTKSKGGRAYYLELIEKNADAKISPRPASMDSLYSRWSSQGALNAATSRHHRQSTKALAKQELTTKPSVNGQTRKSRQIVPAATIIDTSATSRPQRSSSLMAKENSNSTKTNSQLRRQLPFGGPPLANRSKSSSCLLPTSAKTSKYSIYGGLKKPNENNKPVPRLSYSRAIGPKSQRQIDAQPKTPSRYLKMK